MFCPRCGREVSQEGLCPVCSAQPASQPAVAAIRKSAGSVWMLLACIAFSLSTVLSLINSFRYTYVHAELSTANWWSALILLASSLPILIGLWRLYAAGHSRSGGFSTAGLTLIKAGLIVTIVFCGILAGVFLLVAGIGTLRASALPRDLALDMDQSGLLLAVCGVFTLVFVYCGRLLCTLGLIRRNLTAPALSHRVSILVVVVNGFMVLSLLTELFVSYFHLVPPINMPISKPDLAVTLLDILFLTSFSVVLLQYRHRIHTLAPAYGSTYPPAYAEPAAHPNHMPVNAVASVQLATGGSPVAAPPALYCRQCGQAVIPGDAVCGHCGTAIH